MGLRTASVRRPHVEVMAPALTETTQAQNFKLPTKDHLQPASPINNSKYHPNGRGTYCKEDPLTHLDDDHHHHHHHHHHQDDDNNDNNAKEVDDIKLDDAVSNLNTLALVSETLLTASGSTIMNDSPPMGDQMENMGLQKTDSVSKIHNDKTNDVEQLLNNLTSTDLSQNVDDLMQVIKSIENSSPNELETEFPVISNNLTQFEKLLNDVDMLNISMEDQTDFDANNETKSENLIAELKAKQAKVERRLDFLRRKIRKLQSRHMGGHITDEITGVFETVQRSLKRPKDDQPSTSNNNNDDKPKPMTCAATKSMLKKLEMTAAMQASSSSRQKHLIKYFGSGSTEPSNCNSVMNIITPWPIDQKQELQKVAGMLHTELCLVQREVDSEATESSSGGESCDELQNYNNPHQQYLSIQKRSLWKYLTSRAAIAARWTWLQAQISDLEYRIRQHTDLHRQIRSTKGPVTLDGENPPSPTSMTTTSPTAAVNGYRGQLPGSSPISFKAVDATSSTTSSTATTTVNNGAHIDYQCARTRPLVNFKKRKLLQTAGLHVVSKKASRPSTIRCGCTPPIFSCAICTGRTDPTHPRDPPEALSKSERIALVDPSFHPVFSLPDDVSCGVHCDAIMKISEWQQRSARMKSLKVLKSDRSEKALLEARAKKLEHRKKYGRLLKPSTVSALSAKIKNKMRGRKISRHPSSSTFSKINNRKRSTSKVAMAQLQALVGDDDEVESIGNIAASHSVMASPSSSPLLHMQAISGYNRRNRANSYDIDNIVIPYSVAAATRVEKLQYKEILTPKWRIADPDLKCDTKNNGAVKNPSQDSDAEDLSDDAVVLRHEKCEYDEKKKFLSYLKLPLGYGRSRSHKRTDSLAESSGANTPDPMSPHPIEQQENTNSPLTSPPVTPLPIPPPPPLLLPPHVEDHLPSIGAMRKRTTSQSRFLKDRELNNRDENIVTAENMEVVAPFELRTFPLDDETFDKMLENMPEDHQLKTNVRAQDSQENNLNYLDDKVDSPDSESTESAIGDEDPNDPEWVDMERSRDRHKR